jgi:hypothetical protein
MPKRTTRTSDRTRLLKSWLRANFDRCVADHIPMREAAAEATAALSFFVSASYMRHCSHLLRYRWPRNPRPHRKGNPGPRAHRPSPLDGTPLEHNIPPLTERVSVSRAWLREQATLLLGLAVSLESQANTP